MKQENLFEPNKIRVYSGKYIDVFNPQVEDIDIIDIAHGLAHQCRFGGHTQVFYSVAQHSIEVMNFVKKIIESVECEGLSEEQLIYYQLTALLHDAPEAYILDFPSPNKRRMGGKYIEVERSLFEAISKYVTGTDELLYYIETNEVVAGDLYQLQYEWKNIVIESKILPLSSSIAKELFIVHYNNLKNQLDELRKKQS